MSGTFMGTSRLKDGTLIAWHHETSKPMIWIEQDDNGKRAFYHDYAGQRVEVRLPEDSNERTDV